MQASPLMCYAYLKNNDAHTKTYLQERGGRNPETSRNRQSCSRENSGIQLPKKTKNQNVFKEPTINE